MGGALELVGAPTLNLDDIARAHDDMEHNRVAARQVVRTGVDGDRARPHGSSPAANLPFPDPTTAPGPTMHATRTLLPALLLLAACGEDANGPCLAPDEVAQLSELEFEGITDTPGEWRIIVEEAECSFHLPYDGDLLDCTEPDGAGIPLGAPQLHFTDDGRAFEAVTFTETLYVIDMIVQWQGAELVRETLHPNDHIDHDACGAVIGRFTLDEVTVPEGPSKP